MKKAKSIIEFIKVFMSLQKAKGIVEFYVRFERIYPFQDGNGRVGRIIMFKECLRHGIVPFII